jgi:hypothetical protein
MLLRTSRGVVLLGLNTGRSLSFAGIGGRRHLRPTALGRAVTSSPTTAQNVCMIKTSPMITAAETLLATQLSKAGRVDKHG